MVVQWLLDLLTSLLVTLFGSLGTFTAPTEVGWGEYGANVRWIVDLIGGWVNLTVVLWAAGLVLVSTIAFAVFRVELLLWSVVPGKGT